LNHSPRLGVAYLGNRTPRHAARDLDEISGVCDYVVHTVSETDISFHKSALGKIFAHSRRKKLEVWADPWGLGGVFGGESFSHYLVQHRDSWQVLSDGRIVPSACLNRPEFSHLLKEWILTVRDMGAQVIFWDEPHLHWNIDTELSGVFSCACPLCAELFKKQFKAPLPKRLTLETQEFRLQTLKDFLSGLMRFAHAKGLRNALCVYAVSGLPAYENLWEAAAGLSDLDIFGCDPYWRFNTQPGPPQKKVALFARKTVEAAARHHKASQIWIQAMKFPSGRESEIATAVREAAGQGTDYIAAWSYDGGELIDTVLSEDPETVWKTVKKVYTQLRKG
jgi:hypothetical protein